MSSSSLKSHKFRLDREDGWKRLEFLLKRVESRSLKSLTDEDLIALPTLYRATLSSLSVARATSLDQDVTLYLESLTTRAYFAIYGNKSSMFERIGYFFSHSWPRAVQSLTKETLAALIITVLGALIAYSLVTSNSDWYFSFIPEGLAGDRSPASTYEELRKTLYSGGDSDSLSVFATYLFSHNSRVAILAFALGFAFAVPSVVLLLYNGFTLGAFIAIFVDKGLGYELGGWLSIHGTTEIFAIVLAGSAGMKIGWSVAFPGERSRMDAVSSATSQSAAVLGGVIIMLFCAGLLEGFGRQLIVNDEARYAIGFVALTLWLLYFYLPRPDEDAQNIWDEIS
ncbi:MAG: hypothetical protein COA43_15575 [Robiginitomaculum sp.]|nr:MAG: hypothetical protein COA43_15575 [Robiginitomaculum sp.]